MFEENSGDELPLRPPAYIRRTPLPTDLETTYYFDEQGRPSTETARRLHQEMVAHLFVLDGRLRPQHPVDPTTSSIRAWNRYLSDLGYEVEAGLAPWERDNRLPVGGEARAAEGEEEERQVNTRQDLWGGGSIPPPHLARSRNRRRLQELSPSDWKRVLESRLAVIFNRPPHDYLIQKMARMMSRVADWGKWGIDPQLQPLRDDCCKKPHLWILVERLELVEFDRYIAAHPRTLKRNPLRAIVENEMGRFTFVFPRWPKRFVQRSCEGFHVLLAAERHFMAAGCTTDPRVYAAAVWLAGPFLLEPSELCHGRVTLQRIAKHFGLTTRQVHHAAQKLLKASRSTLPIPSNKN